MAHNRWLVDFRLQQVPSVTYGWSAGHGGCLRDRRSHPEGGCAYGSGAAGRAGPAGTICWVRWDDARHDSKGCAEHEKSEIQGCRAPVCPTATMPSTHPGQIPAARQRPPRARGVLSALIGTVSSVGTLGLVRFT